MARITSGIAASVLLLLLGGCGGSDAADRAAEPTPQAAELATGGSGAGGGPAAPVQPDTPGTDASLQEDRAIFDATMERARREGLAELPIGERIVALGRWFVGADYVPGTLEVVPEQLVVNLRQFDCVTYVESILAMARVLGGPVQTFDAFQEEIRTIRYRDGLLAGYPSRLHYFSDWIVDNENLGIVQDVTRGLAGIPLDEPIDFMTSNRQRYPALAAPAVLEEIGRQERALSARSLHYIPKNQIATIAEQIQNGDIIAATSAIRGLDVAHTGLAIWIDGDLHLMHAPLVGSSVEISERPLAERIMGISGQDGIIVARPVE
jgi:hypothetical protein